MSVSLGNVVGVLGVSVMIPGIDFLGLEFPEIEIVVGSLEDCVCISDMVRSLFSLISLCDLLFKPDFKGKSVLLVALLEELLHSLGSNVSEMLEESIRDWVTTSVSGNSWNGKSGDGIGSGSGTECWISIPLSEKRIALLGSWTFFNTNILPVCWYCCQIWGMYSFKTPLSSKKSACI